MTNKVFSVLAILIIAVSLAACGGDGGSSDCSDSLILGAYETGTGDILTFNSECRWTSQDCQSSGTYPSFTEASGTVTVQVTNSPLGSDFGCLDEGSASCTYVLGSGDSFSFICSQN